MKGKFSPDQESKKKPSGKGNAAIVVIIAVLMVACLALGVVLILQNTTQPEPEQPATEPTVAEVPAATDGDGQFFDELVFEEAYRDSIRHAETQINGSYMEVFYMTVEETDRELFRVCFDNPQMGTLIGSVEFRGKLVPVSIVASGYEVQDFADANAYSTYCDLMELAGTVSDFIQSKAGYAAQNSGLGMTDEKQTVNLVFWSLELPSNISWKETTGNQFYCADFYFQFGEKQILLYTLSLGSEHLEDAVGMFEIDGGMTPVCITPHKLSSDDAWIAQMYSGEYAALMNTINDVLQVVMSDERFLNNIP